MYDFSGIMYEILSNIISYPLFLLTSFLVSKFIAKNQYQQKGREDSFITSLLFLFVFIVIFYSP